MSWTEEREPVGISETRYNERRVHAKQVYYPLRVSKQSRHPEEWLVEVLSSWHFNLSRKSTLIFFRNLPKFSVYRP